MGKNRLDDYDKSLWVTVNTDASYDPKTCTGGFGIWIKSSFFTLKHSGKFKGTITDANEAEMKAVINALHILGTNRRKFKVLIINCDNQFVRNLINKKQQHSKFKESGMLVDMLHEYDIAYAKHIRGHTRGDTSREWVNNWCDRHSKKYRHG